MVESTTRMSAMRAPMSVSATVRAGVCTIGSLVCLSALGAAAVAGAQTSTVPPFATGERLTYVVHAKLGSSGTAVMALTGPVDVRGTETLLASFDTKISVAMMKGSDESRSWIDVGRMASLRFTKHEHRPFASDDDSVEIYPNLRRWVESQGDSGTTRSAAPLDELSFIYFLRTLSLVPDSTYSFDRHYDQRRTPTTVRVVKHETLQTPAGSFETVELEMRVKDGSDYKGEGVLHLWFSEDRCHLPVRIESAMPLLGTGTMILESAVTPGCHAGQTPRHLEKP